MIWLRIERSVLISKFLSAFIKFQRGCDFLNYIYSRKKFQPRRIRCLESNGMIRLRRKWTGKNKSGLNCSGIAIILRNFQCLNYFWGRLNGLLKISYKYVLNKGGSIRFWREPKLKCLIHGVPKTNKQKVHCRKLLWESYFFRRGYFKAVSSCLTFDATAIYISM